MITGVVGITLWTQDLEGMFRFYHDVLHLPLHSRHEDFIAFQLGDLRFGTIHPKHGHLPINALYSKVEKESIISSGSSTG